MRALIVILLLSILSSRGLAQQKDLRAFLDGLQKPIVLDTDAQRQQAPKGRMLVDELVVYALRDGGGKRFCVSYYGYYGEQWLTERKRGLFVILPRPIEQFGWGGFSPARRSPEELEVAKLLADAAQAELQVILNPPP